MRYGRRRAFAPDKIAECIHASYFFDFYDEEFLSEAYIRLLKRPLDPTGAADYLSAIRAGRSRYVILDNISRSSEAKIVGVKLIGMTSYRYMKIVGKIPVVSHLIEAATLLISTKSLMSDLRALENHVYRISKANDLNHS